MFYDNNNNKVKRKHHLVNNTSTKTRRENETKIVLVSLGAFFVHFVMLLLYRYVNLPGIY